jgi:glycosyltransferase involved in cell wall biosynthesis
MALYTTNDLEILVATMNRDNLLFLEVMFQQSIATIKAPVLVVNQSKTKILKSDWQHIRVINSRVQGLSKSRNLAIENSTKKLCWLMDDDCVILPGAANKIVAAHNQYPDAILTFKTQSTSGQDFYTYNKVLHKLNKKSITKVLSPEITFKRHSINNVNLRFDTRFGLGAQFQDSENYVFLDDALKRQLKLGFVPETVVQHPSKTSSDDVASNRVIYARGAIAGRRNIMTAAFYQLKYVFFLWRKGYVRSFVTLWEKFVVFRHGANDYFTGFEGHRINHPKQ